MLRSTVIHLASEHPELRPHLLPLLKEAGWQSLLEPFSDPYEGGPLGIDSVDIKVIRGKLVTLIDGLSDLVKVDTRYQGNIGPFLTKPVSRKLPLMAQQARKTRDAAKALLEMIDGLG